MKTYPEHEKLQKIADKSQEVGGFIDWLQSEKGVVFCIEEQKNHGVELRPFHISIEKSLAEYFEIDLEKIQTEKKEILDDIQELNKRQI